MRHRDFLWDPETLDLDLAAAIHEARETLLPLGVVLCDLDNFKDVNDLHGHKKGDAVIAEIASRILQVVRGKGRAYRYGGSDRQNGWIERRIAAMMHGADPPRHAAWGGRG